MAHDGGSWRLPELRPQNAPTKHFADSSTWLGHVARREAEGGRATSGRPPPEPAFARLHRRRDRVGLVTLQNPLGKIKKPNQPEAATAACLVGHGPIRPEPALGGQRRTLETLAGRTLPIAGRGAEFGRQKPDWKIGSFLRG